MAPRDMTGILREWRIDVGIKNLKGMRRAIEKATNRSCRCRNRLDIAENAVKEWHLAAAATLLDSEMVQTEFALPS